MTRFARFSNVMNSAIQIPPKLASAFSPPPESGFVARESSESVFPGNPGRIGKQPGNFTARNPPDVARSQPSKSKRPV